MNDELEKEPQDIADSEDSRQDELTRIAEESEQRFQQLKRAQADLINYKKDESKRIQDIVAYGNQQILMDFLDVIDGLEMIIQHVPEPVKESQKNWFAGIVQVKKQFEEVLSRYGVRKIEVKDHFDPNLHEAISTGETDHGKDDKDALSEIRSGYTLHGRVMRPARVKVNKPI